LFLSISERSVQIQNESITRLCITNSRTSYSKFSFSSPIQASLYPYLFIFPAQPRDYKRNLQTHTLGARIAQPKPAKQRETRKQIIIISRPKTHHGRSQHQSQTNTTQPCYNLQSTAQKRERASCFTIQTQRISTYRIQTNGSKKSLQRKVVLFSHFRSRVTFIFLRF